MRQPQLPILADMVQVRYEAERAREQAQKQLAAAEGRVGVLHTRLDDVLSDNRALKHKVWMLMTGPERCCAQPDELVQTASVGYSLLHTSPPVGRTCWT